MKYFKRAGIYKASNVSFDPKEVSAHSYRWWTFVKVIQGKTIFNNYRYSNSTNKHQSKVRSLMRELDIHIDLELPVPRGLQEYDDLRSLYVAAEEQLCNQFLANELKRDRQNIRAKKRRQTKKLESYLENEVHFRDYEIKDKEDFGRYHIQAVHQVVDMDSVENDVQNALHSFHRDGFGKVVFYL